MCLPRQVRLPHLEWQCWLSSLDRINWDSSSTAFFDFFQIFTRPSTYCFKIKSDNALERCVYKLAKANSLRLRRFWNDHLFTCLLNGRYRNSSIFVLVIDRFSIIKTLVCLALSSSPKLKVVVAHTLFAGFQLFKQCEFVNTNCLSLHFNASSKNNFGSAISDHWFRNASKKVPNCF